MKKSNGLTRFTSPYGLRTFNQPKMKTFKVCILTAGLLLPFVNEVKAISEINPVRRVSMETSEAARANALLYRLDEINTGSSRSEMKKM